MYLKESGLSDKIIWKEVPHHSNRGLNFGDFLTIVRKKTNSTIIELEDITNKLFQPKNSKNKNSGSSTDFRIEEAPQISVLNKMFKNSNESEEDFTNKELASHEPNSIHSISDIVPSNLTKSNKSEYDEIQKLINKNYERIHFNQMLSQNLTREDELYPHQFSQMQRQSNLEKKKQIIIKNYDNIQNKNDTDLYTEKELFNEEYSIDLDSKKNLFSKHYLESRTTTFSKEYSREIPDEADYSPRENEFQHFDIENQNDSSSQEVPLKSIQNFSSKIESNPSINSNDDFTLEKKIPEYLDKFKNLQKPWQYQNSQEVSTYNKYDENPPFVNRLASKYTIPISNEFQTKSDGNLDLRGRNRTRLKQKNLPYRAGSKQTIKYNESNKKAQHLSDYLMRFGNIEKDGKNIHSSLDEKFSEIDSKLISDGNQFENDPSMEKDLYDQNKQKPIRRNYLRQVLQNKYFQSKDFFTEKQKIFEQEHQKVKENLELSDLFRNDQPVNTNREEILAIQINPTYLPINEAVMTQGENLPEEYPSAKISTRAKKSSLKVTGEDHDSE